LAKTGGKLVAVEFEKDRYDEAVANFRAAGLSQYVDARLRNEHDIIPALKGPFDFVSATKKRRIKNATDFTD
jgi:caffeoyl-CoA O-methyltransferase